MTVAREPEGPPPWPDATYLVLFLLIALLAVRGCAGYVSDVGRIVGR